MKGYSSDTINTKLFGTKAGKQPPARIRVCNKHIFDNFFITGRQVSYNDVTTDYIELAGREGVGSLPTIFRVEGDTSVPSYISETAEVANEKARANLSEQNATSAAHL